LTLHPGQVEAGGNAELNTPTETTRLPSAAAAGKHVVKRILFKKGIATGEMTTSAAVSRRKRASIADLFILALMARTTPSERSSTSYAGLYTKC
jgi:hypothetical protein